MAEAIGLTKYRRGVGSGVEGRCGEKPFGPVGD